MSGKLLAQARKDLIKIANAGGFEKEIKISTGDLELETTGLTTGHTQRFDNEGNAVQSKSFHVSIHEQNLIDGQYPYKNTRGKISLVNHKISFLDGNGELTNWVINECLPNATTGLIVCILGTAD